MFHKEASLPQDRHPQKVLNLKNTYKSVSQWIAVIMENA